MSTRHRQIVIGTSAMCLASAATVAQTQMWARQFGSPGHDYVRGAAEEDSGGAYIVGTTDGPLFEPAGGTFVARFNGAGDLLWGRQLADFGSTAASPGSEGVFVCGWTGASVFGPNAGMDDAVLVRYDGAGELMWGQQFGSDAYDGPSALASDGIGGAFMTGWTEGSLAGASAGGRDIWITRFTPSGERAWLRQFGSSAGEWANAAAPDGAGGFLLAGQTEGDLGEPSAGGADAWVARFDSAGNQVWIRQFGTGEYDEGHGVASDGDDGLFTCGQTGLMGTPSWRPWLQHRDGAGNLIWERVFEPELFGEDVAPDGVGGVFVSGYTRWDGPGGTNAWVARYTAAGERVMFHELSTGAADYPSALIPAGSGSAVVAGFTWGGLGGLHHGLYDAWLARYGESCYADLDGSGALDLFDFLAFVNLFNGADPAADCDASGALDLFDFLCFTNAFNAGC